MKTQYLVMVQHVNDQKENKWWNLKFFVGNHFGDRYFTNEETARAELEKYIKNHNRDFEYDKDGKRLAKVDILNGLGISVIADKQADDNNRVIAYKIKKREVTEWEVIE